MRKLYFIAALCLPALANAQLPTKEPAKPAAAPAAAPAKPAAAAPTGPLATVNGVAVPRQRLETVIRELAGRGTQDSEQLRGQVRENLINNELLNQEAGRSGVARKPEVLQLIELNRQEIIANTVIGDHLRANPVSDADIQKEYERVKAQAGEREFRARHILVATEDDAKGVIAELKRGAKFDDLAQKRSQDEGSRPRGGDLDWNVPTNFDKAFSDAMVKLEKGKMTEAPVRTRFGFHVIQLDDVRAVNFPPLSQVRQQLQQGIARQRVDTFVRDLRAKARIE